MHILDRWRRRLRFYGDCPSCGHDWREHPGSPAIDGLECGESVYELEHGERPEDAGPCAPDAPLRRPEGCDAAVPRWAAYGHTRIMASLG